MCFINKKKFHIEKMNTHKSMSQSRFKIKISGLLVFCNLKAYSNIYIFTFCAAYKKILTPSLKYAQENFVVVYFFDSYI